MVDLRGVVLDIHYVAEHRCSVYFLRRSGVEITMTLTDTERANNKYNTKMAAAYEELQRRESELSKKQ